MSAVPFDGAIESNSVLYFRSGPVVAKSECQRQVRVDFSRVYTVG